MFESLEIRRVTNGYIVVVHTETEEKEYVYDSSRKVDCGSGTCIDETQTIDCVQSITGQSGLTLYSGSPIAAC